jgi:hypothetical protein
MNFLSLLSFRSGHTWCLWLATNNILISTRYVIPNGPAINLMSTIDVHNKLVIARGIYIYIYFNVHHVVKRKNHDFFFFIFVHHISYGEPKRDVTLNDDMF